MAVLARALGYPWDIPLPAIRISLALLHRFAYHPKTTHHDLPHLSSPLLSIIALFPTSLPVFAGLAPFPYFCVRFRRS